MFIFECNLESQCFIILILILIKFTNLHQFDFILSFSFYFIVCFYFWIFIIVELLDYLMKSWEEGCFRVLFEGEMMFVEILWICGAEFWVFFYYFRVHNWTIWRSFSFWEVLRYLFLWPWGDFVIYRIINRSKFQNLFPRDTFNHHSLNNHLIILRMSLILINLSVFSNVLIWGWLRIWRVEDDFLTSFVPWSWF